MFEVVDPLELRHNVEIHNLTGRVVECLIDELSRPRGAGKAMLRIPPSAAEVAAAGYRVGRVIYQGVRACGVSRCLPLVGVTTKSCHLPGSVG
ncbi:hypothetical protein HC031_20780 [Planosporangium thailandense]|uniref:Uncharacterized protein n=1 Tax=Planosporangium thailandense TaxID=765197 RepID=A0ABX0Y3Y0_9ACTN|nr:hypothetical protein [Planosporangium thailandense]NJC72132.1 hypothetical protein [Planosporangium thailandense]